MFAPQSTLQIRFLNSALAIRSSSGGCPGDRQKCPICGQSIVAKGVPLATTVLQPGCPIQKGCLRSLCRLIFHKISTRWPQPRRRGLHDDGVSRNPVQTSCASTQPSARWGAGTQKPEDVSLRCLRVRQSLLPYSLVPASSPRSLARRPRHLRACGRPASRLANKSSQGPRSPSDPRRSARSWPRAFRAPSLCNDLRLRFEPATAATPSTTTSSRGGDGNEEPLDTPVTRRPNRCSALSQAREAGEGRFATPGNTPC